MFQSTRPRGARPTQMAYYSRGRMFQSTRPRGARPSEYEVPCVGISFNPRARAGRDEVIQSAFINKIMFQSTRPRGARLKITNIIVVNSSFNPRARAGRDFRNVRNWL